MSGKISVSKQGDIYRVPVDPASNQPLHIASYDDEPPGAFMQTYTSLQELHANFPGKEFLFLEPPARKEQVVKPLPAHLARKVDDMARKHKVDVGKSRTLAVAEETMEELPYVKPNDDARLLHAQEFLKRLTTAREYASKKNQGTLDIKIAAVQELIDEVFKA